METKLSTPRAEWKKVQRLNHIKFDEWALGYAADNYYDGVHDCVLAFMMCLHDDHKFGNKRMKLLLEHVYDVVAGFNTKEIITPTEMLEGLKSIGFNIEEHDAVVRETGHAISGVIIKCSD